MHSDHLEYQCSRTSTGDGCSHILAPARTRDVPQRDGAEGPGGALLTKIPSYATYALNWGRPKEKVRKSWRETRVWSE
eukprot:1979083-Pyramimonas_sp.AAC.1